MSLRQERHTCRNAQIVITVHVCDSCCGYGCVFAVESFARSCSGIRIVTLIFRGDRGSAVVKVLCYKSEGRWFVAQWLRYCATNRKVAGSIPDVIIGIFH
jgi:hypothetical protein